jgi:hypothetical protein
MRLLLRVAGLLVTIVGLPLFFVPQASDEYFSWTVGTDLSAAFLGASYLAAAVIEFVAARERKWANARIAVPAVLAFTLLTLFITLANEDQFNYSAPEFVQSAATWAWSAVYVVVPPIMLTVLWLQTRQGGGDPPPVRSLSSTLRGTLASGGVALGLGGAALITDPIGSAWIWPWEVNALSGRAFGAWMIGFGVALAHIAWEGDWRRVRPATSGAGALGALQLVVLLRYLDSQAWEEPKIRLYVAVMFGFVMLGLTGWRVASGLGEADAVAVSAEAHPVPRS